MRITNLSDLADISDYRIEAMVSANPIAGSPPGVAGCEGLQHDRRQSVWTLLQRACAELMEADWIDL
jgi:hypothetical protein